jgi:hypothetical protein
MEKISSISCIQEAKCSILIVSYRTEREANSGTWPSLRSIIALTEAAHFRRRVTISTISQVRPPCCSCFVRRREEDRMRSSNVFDFSVDVVLLPWDLLRFLTNLYGMKRRPFQWLTASQTQKIQICKMQLEACLTTSFSCTVPHSALPLYSLQQQVVWQPSWTLL